MHERVPHKKLYVYIFMLGLVTAGVIRLPEPAPKINWSKNPSAGTLSAILQTVTVQQMHCRKQPPSGRPDACFQHPVGLMARQAMQNNALTLGWADQSLHLHFV
jgi:hypothetical protein